MPSTHFFSFGATGGGAAPVPYLGLVSSRAYFPTASTGSPQVMSSIGFDWTDDVTEVQVLIPTVWASSFEILSIGNVTYHCSIEYPAGVFNEVLWGGSTTKTTVANVTENTGLSDPLTVNAVRGERAKFHCYATVPVSGGITLGQGSSSSIRWTAGGDASIIGTVVTDAVMTGGITHGGVDAFIFPFILGMTTRKTVSLMGDSTTLGTGFTPNAANGQTGEVAIFFGKDYGLFNAAQGGTRLKDFVAGNGIYRRRLATQYTTHVINHYQKNDFDSAGGNSTAGQLLVNYKAFPLLFTNKVIVGSTVGPVTNAGNTIPNANNAARNTLNTAIIAGTDRYSGAGIDIGGFLEQGGLGATGLWQTGYTTDGLHGNATAQTGLQSSGVLDPVAVLARSTAPRAYSPLALGSVKAPLYFDASTIDVMAATVPILGTRATFTATAATLGATAFGGVAPGVTLNGTTASFIGDNTFAKAWSNAAPAITLASLFYPTSTPAGDRLVIGHTINGSNGDRAMVYINSSNKVVLKYRRLDADTLTTLTSTASVPNNTPSMVVAIFNPTSNAVSLFINGVADVTGTFLSSGAFPATNSNNYAVGTISGAFTPMIFHTLFSSDVALTTDERQKLEGFLAWNVGLAGSLLPGGHPFLSTAPSLN